MSEQALSNQEILAHFTSSVEKLLALVQNLSEAELDFRTDDADWTIRQIIHHLADDGDVWSLCIKKAIATPGVTIQFAGYPGNEVWGQGLDFEKREVWTAIDLIGVHRRYLAQLLEHFSGIWEQSVKFSNAEGEIVGEMTIGQMVKMISEHMWEHVEAIEQAMMNRN